MKTHPLLATLTLTASLLLAGSAGAIQLQNLTINGQPYVEGMTIPAGTASLKIAGNIVTEDKDNAALAPPSWASVGKVLEIESTGYVWIDYSTYSHYPGFGFFAIGSAPCVVQAPQRAVTAMPDPARCIPNWALDTGAASGYSPTGWSDPNSANFGFYIKPNFDNAKTTFAGAFEKTVPLPASTAAGAFTLTYQLNSAVNVWTSDAKGYSVGALWGSTDPANSNHNSNNFMPRATLAFNYRAAAFASVNDASALTAKTLSGTVTTRQQDEGKKGSLFVAAVLTNGEIYSRDSSGGWTLWDGVTPFRATQSGVTLAATHSVDILKTATDISGLKGTRVYVGYGVGDTDSAAYADLLAGKTANTYGLIYTVQ